MFKFRLYKNPIGGGVSTRLILKGKDDKLYNWVVQEYHSLRDQIHTWQDLFCDAKPNKKKKM